MTFDPYDRWMIRQNIANAAEEGLDVVVARLRVNGYLNVAEAVRVACVKICAHCGREITFSHGYWRDDDQDPGDGFGGDASCYGRELGPRGHLPHEPRQ